MSSETVDAKPLLSIPEAFLYEVKENNPVLIAQGPLVIFQIDSMEGFILQVGEHYSYSVLKDMPVLASSNEEGALRSYVLSNVDNYIIIRIVSVPDKKLLENLEVFFAQNTKFAEKGELHGAVVPKPEGQEVQPSQESAKWTFSWLIYKGGEVIKDVIIAGAELVARGINAGGEYIQNNYLKKENIEISETTMKALQYAGTATGWVLKFKRSKVQQLINYGKRVMINTAKKRTQIDPNGVDGIKQIGSATIYGLLSIYEGMMDALDIIQDKGIHETTAKMFGHRYGERVGTAARHFFNSMSNSPQRNEAPNNNKPKEVVSES
jgi:hypothetical protein